MKLFNLGVATGITINSSSNDDSAREIIEGHSGLNARAAKFKGMG